jgi:hypothetical protein
VVGLVLPLFTAVLWGIVPAARQVQLRLNERRALSGCRQVAHAQERFYKLQAPYSYAASLRQLRSAAAGRARIDPELASGLKWGYLFRLEGTRLENGGYSGYQLVARPLEYMVTGRRSLYMNETGEIRAGDTGGRWGAPGLDPVDYLDPGRPRADRGGRSAGSGGVSPHEASDGGRDGGN